MIDEELYVLATQELNSDQRRADLWARAIALASEDHDEARYLYTNLRVEELVAEREASDNQSQTDPKAGYEPVSEPGTPLLADEQPSGTDLGFDEMKPISTTGEPEVSWQGGSQDDAGSENFSDAGGVPFSAPASAADDTQDLAPLNSMGSEQFDEYVEDDSASMGNRSNLFEDTSSSLTAELDPLERTEPEGFDMADDSMELTAPEDLPPVTIDTNYSNTPDIQSDNGFANAHYESSLDDYDGSLDDDATGRIDGFLQTEDLPTDVNQHRNAAATAAGAAIGAVGSVAAGGAAAEFVPQPALNSGPAYQVLEHRDGSRTAVKIGKSTPALLLTLPWLIYKRLWGTAIVYILMAAVLLFGLFSTGLGLLDAGADASLQQKLVFGAFALLALVGLLYVPWSQGNSWIAARLQRKGYRQKIAVNAQSARDALDLSRAA